ncbi:NADH dehydrogenase [bioreactor metagenome]|uniref:NADH dehydrogenase n=1 Tax=bioreactor metagenome TaxID=1076179 RepID=A0A644T5Z3_9ZZZZ|nr:FAD-dependent oxidoreductase [Candidatus Elulimicrobiales bacterium]
MENTIFDLIIVGGGPAGASAAVYAARKRLKTALVLKEWGGQSTVSEDIQNWIGTPHISGMQLAKNLETHVKEYAGDVLEIKTDNLVTKSEIFENENSEKLIKLTLENGKEIISKSLLITTGSNRRKLDAINADKFEHKGLTYCSTCDGPMFTGMDVVVVGGGNAGFESAAQLLAYCKSVILLSRSEPRADKITIDKLLENSNFKLIKNITIKEIHGDVFVDGLTYVDKETGEETKMNASGIFIEIGQIPATDWVKDLVELDEEKKVKIDPWTNRASKENLIWAAGDCTNILYHQNNIASGEAVKAVEDIYKTLKTK